MAKRIVWSERAERVFKGILEFYAIRNGTKTYSRKHNNQIRKTVSLLIKHPLLGRETDIENIRAILKKDYEIYYKIENEDINIVLVWDVRQNPDNLKF